MEARALRPMLRAKNEGPMFNDDVTARCPACGGTDIYYTSTKIGCHACHTEEPFEFDFAAPNASLEPLNRAHALAVLQRWAFAG